MQLVVIDLEETHLAHRILDQAADPQELSLRKVRQERVHLRQLLNVSELLIVNDLQHVLNLLLDEGVGLLDLLLDALEEYLVQFFDPP